jgi:hypothetical protein
MHNLSAVRSFSHYPVVNMLTEIVGSNGVGGHDHYWNNDLRNSYAQSESITATISHDRDRAAVLAARGFRLLAPVLRAVATATRRTPHRD